VQANEKISIVWNTTVDAIVGTKMVEKARLKHADGSIEELPCAGVFAYIGLVPNSDFIPSAIARDEQGYLTTGASFETTAAGVYAIGAVRSGHGGTLDAAISEAQSVANMLAQRLA
jgi:thioredoxin reductase (NADPH)